MDTRKHIEMEINDERTDESESARDHDDIPIDRANSTEYYEIIKYTEYSQRKNKTCAV